MADQPVTREKLINADKDVQVIEDFIKKPKDETVITRFGDEIMTLKGLEDEVKKSGGYFKRYTSLAAANADIANIPVNGVVKVTDPIDGGDYYKASSDATTLTKSPWDPLTLAKAYASDYTDTKFTDIKSYVDSLSYAANEVLLRAVFNDLINQIEELKAGENSWTDSLISTESGLTQRQLNNKFRSLKQFGADGNGTENDTVAIEAASEWMETNGGTVIVTSGDYYVLNAEIGGTWIFEKGARFVNPALPGNSNMVIAKAGLKMFGPSFYVKRANMPSSGNSGNFIRIGRYDESIDQALIDNVIIRDFYFESDDSGSLLANGLTILGNVKDISICDGTFKGAGTRIVAHWGGDVDLTNPHANYITFAHLPNGLRFENITYKPGSSGSIEWCLTVSNCYNVTIRNLRTNNARSSLEVFCGDIYDLVTVEAQKHKSLTSITIDGVYVESPTEIPIGAVRFLGSSTANRVSGTPGQMALEPDAPMQIVAKNIVLDLKNKVWTNYSPVTFTRVKNIEADIQVLNAKGVTKSVITADTCFNSKFNFTYKSKRGPNLNMVRNSQVFVNGVFYSDSLPDSSNVGLSCSSGTSAPYTCLVDILQNDETWTVTNSTSSSISFIEGMDVKTNENQYIFTLQETKIIAAGETYIFKTSAAEVSVLAGSTLRFSSPSDGTTISGSCKGFYNNLSIGNPKNLGAKEFNSIDSYDSGINVIGTYEFGVLTLEKCKFVNSNTSKAANKYSLNFSSSGMRLAGARVINCDFDAGQYNRNIANHINVASTAHSGLIITGNNFGKIDSDLSIKIKAVTSSNFSNPQAQIYANNDANTKTVEDTMVSGMYINGIYQGLIKSNSLASIGALWKPGDKIFVSEPAALGFDGWVRTANAIWQKFGEVSTTVTTANLQSSTNAINAAKFAGKEVYNITTGKKYYATGSAATSTWVSFDGSSIITPI